MASKNETVVDIKSEMYGIVADEFGYVKLAQSDFIGIADRIDAAHNREIAAKDAEIAELQRKYADACKCCDDAERRLRVAKDALENLVDEEGIVCDCEIVYKANNVIAMISGEGGNDEQH